MKFLVRKNSILKALCFITLIQVVEKELESLNSSKRQLLGEFESRQSHLQEVESFVSLLKTDCVWGRRGRRAYLVEKPVIK